MTPSRSSSHQHCCGGCKGGGGGGGGEGENGHPREGESEQRTERHRERDDRKPVRPGTSVGYGGGGAADTSGVTAQDSSVAGREAEASRQHRSTRNEESQSTASSTTRVGGATQSKAARSPQQRKPPLLTLTNVVSLEDQERPCCALQHLFVNALPRWAARHEQCAYMWTDTKVGYAPFLTPYMLFRAILEASRDESTLRCAYPSCVSRSWRREGCIVRVSVSRGNLSPEISQIRTLYDEANTTTCLLNALRRLTYTTIFEVPVPRCHADVVYWLSCIMQQMCSRYTIDVIVTNDPRDTDIMDAHRFRALDTVDASRYESVRRDDDGTIDEGCYEDATNTAIGTTSCKDDDISVNYAGDEK